jgi:3-oxoacyl-[acyl-carrier protein] reductase
MLKLDLSGRIVLITGATGDLGRVMVRTLAGCGADIAVHYHRNRGKAEALAAEVRAAGPRACVVQADVGDPAQVDAMRETVAAALGYPDIVVANAVIQCYPWQSVLDQPLTDYESQWQTGTVQNVLLAKAFVPAMQRRKRGRFIGISTECAMLLDPGSSAYASGKRGLDAVLRVLAKEIGKDGVTVNQVAPGWMISDRYRHDPAWKEPEGYVDTIPLRRRGHDQDIANAVAFIASDLAGFITGAWLPVCGGHVMPAI